MSKLNQKLGTGYDANVSPEIEEALQFCISKDYDFGLTYALLRHCLTSHVDTKQANIRRLKDALDVSTIERRRREQDVDLLNPHDNGYLTIATPYEVKPRRVWDLISHRIIPWECANLSGTNLWAISHSWLDPSARKDIKTAVNGYEWPVPVPMGVTIEAVRNELLSYGAEYCWLDILCLRQHSSSDYNIPEEKIRALEWQIDVPTIGNVYFGKKTKVLRYYNGLGKQFEPRGWNSQFHWTRRAWTLQECKSGSVTGGVYDGDFTRISKMVIQDGWYQGYTMQDFENSKEYAVLSEMRRRYAKTDADKVAGIGFLMSDRLFVGFRKTVELPVFSEKMDAEEAWMRCVRHMPSSMRDELLFRFPMAGSRENGHWWFPSWSQISDINTQLPEDPEGLFLYDDEEGHGKWKNNECSYNGYFIEEGNIMWGEMANNERRGKLLVHGHSFNVLASHQHPIPEGAYSLVGRSNCQDFVICSLVAADLVKHFIEVQKISVIQLPGCHKQLLGNAGVTMKFCTFL
ncbi:hypothetical protein BZA77DRAFT_274806 [Pyronema omphalodes]|nr:hypothetical protein BZA77DRAFT_274806 [Pyronema omphalodes]